MDRYRSAPLISVARLRTWCALLAILPLAVFAPGTARAAATPEYPGRRLPPPPAGSLVFVIPVERVADDAPPAWLNLQVYNTERMQPCLDVESTPFVVPDVFNYLRTSPEFTDSLALRLHARRIKRDLAAREKRDANDAFCASPVAVLIPHPQQQAGSWGGPKCQHGAAVIGSLRRPAPPVRHTVNFLIMDDLMGGQGQDPRFTVRGGMGNDTLDLVMAHENAHGIMYDMLEWQVMNQRRRAGVHTTEMVTEPVMAFSEGWAEAFEAIYGGANDRFREQDRGKHRISEFLFSRQDPIRRERYLWEEIPRRTGRLKTGQRMMATEGVVAGLFYDLLTHRKIDGAFDKSVTVLALEKPDSFPAFLEGWLKRYPADRAILLRLFLETTRYVTVDPGMAELYRSMYEARRGFMAGKRPRGEFEAARSAFVERKERLFADVLEGKRPFTDGLGPVLWLSGYTKDPADGKYHPYGFDLNCATAADLARITGITPDEIALILDRRAAAGGVFKATGGRAVIEELLGAGRFKEFEALGRLSGY